MQAHHHGRSRSLLHEKLAGLGRRYCKSREAGRSGAARTKVANRPEYSSIDDARAGDFHRSATILTLLVFLWGVIALAFVPWDPFGIPNVAQIVIGAALLGFLVRTWKRPRLRVAQVVIALAIGWTLLRLPWATVVWCRLGRPLETFTVPQ